MAMTVTFALKLILRDGFRVGFTLGLTVRAEITVRGGGGLGVELEEMDISSSEKGYQL